MYCKHSIISAESPKENHDCAQNNAPVVLNRNQVGLQQYLSSLASRLRKTYKYPHLCPDEVKKAQYRDDWAPIADEYGHYYTGVIAFHDPSAALINHERLGALPLYHINSYTMVTAFLLRFPVTPYNIEKGRAQKIINAVEKETGANYVGQRSPSPLHPKYSQSIYWRESQTQFDDIDAMLGINTKPIKKTGQSIGDIRQRWDSYQRYLIAKQMKANGWNVTDIAPELNIKRQSVHRLLKQWDNKAPPIDPQTIK